MNVLVNGENKSLAADTSMAGLLAQLELTDRRIAVERNGDIVPRAMFPETMLRDGDRVEIVQAIGGG